ncbi:MAG: ATP-binding protein, partial [Chloroflexota bacterium]
MRRFCEDKSHFFYIADLGTQETTLNEASRRFGEMFFDDPDAVHFASWEQVFKALVRQAQEHRLVVVLDEFTYLLQTDAALPSVLQRLWDETLQHSRLMLVLSGSYIGIMEREVLAYRAPLYGRRTGQWHLQPLTFEDSRLFLPSYSIQDQVRAFAVLGGVPAYLRQFVNRKPLIDNIEDEILSQGSFLYDEPRFLLQMELREPRIYFAILEAIATGEVRQAAISQKVGVKSASLSYYINTLRELGLVSRIVPVTEIDPDRSRQGRYQLLDPYLRFWFRFVYRERVHLERGDTATIRRLVETQIDVLAGYAFEEICRSWVWDASVQGLIPFRPERVGLWWNAQAQIDVAAVNDEYFLVGECRWRSRPMGSDVLQELKRKFAATDDKRHPVFALFSRSGFTQSLQNEAETEGVLLLGMDDTF